MGGRSTDSHSESEPVFESTRCHFKDWEIVFSSSNLGKYGVNICEQDLFVQNCMFPSGKVKLVLKLSAGQRGPGRTLCLPACVG